MPWVRIPVGPLPCPHRTESLKWGTRLRSGYAEPMHHSVQTRVGRVDARPQSTGVRVTPCVRAIQTLTGPVSSGPERPYRGYCATWWIARLRRRRRTCQAAISQGEPHGGVEPWISEWESPRNCLAQWGTPGTETSQYRQEKKAIAMSSVTASERDTVQTEAFGQCGVRTDTHRRNVCVKSPGTERETG